MAKLRLVPNELAVLVVLWSTSACHRYEVRRIQCASEPAGVVASTIAWEQVRRDARSLILGVRTVSGDGPIASGAQVQLDSAGWQVVDAGGVIRFDSLVPGLHLIAVRAVGFRAAHASIYVAADAGVRAVATMAIDPIRLDGGCGMTYRARKPWWKLW